ASALLARQDLNAGQRPVCLHIGARRLMMEGKMWPLHNFSELAAKLVERGYIPLITGVDSEREMAETLCDSVHVCRNLAGCTSIGEMAALISLADLFIGHDSGPFHIAAAVGTPCVAICGRPDAEPEYLNYGRDDVAVITADRPGEIAVDEVFSRAMVLSRHG
ncbi:MAG: glycosyltransferase family 9 protein, partial [Mariprofundaceae bacterium]|nr:glycosyltransferase family 9 protein [Mariprofundaceae bacterium]